MNLLQDKPTRVTQVRKDIARIKTLQNERSRSAAK
jgi:large subunit ribosomal protein L29